MARQRKWIAGALDWPRGTLHAALKVPAGQTIPLATLERAARAPGVLGKRARAALNVRHLQGNPARPDASRGYSHQGVPIHRDEFGHFWVRQVWGDQPGEDRASFRTLRRAKEFIERMGDELRPQHRNPDIPWLLLLAGAVGVGALVWWQHHDDIGPYGKRLYQAIGPPDANAPGAALQDEIGERVLDYHIERHMGLLASDLAVTMVAYDNGRPPEYSLQTTVPAHWTVIVRHGGQDFTYTVPADGGAIFEGQYAVAV